LFVCLFIICFNKSQRCNTDTGDNTGLDASMQYLAQVVCKVIVTCLLYNTVLYCNV